MTPHEVVPKPVIETLERCVCCDVSAPGGQCAAPSGFVVYPCKSDNSVVYHAASRSDAAWVSSGVR